MLKLCIAMVDDGGVIKYVHIYMNIYIYQCIETHVCVCVCSSHSLDVANSLVALMAVK